jgi:hypothetical protein
MNETEWGTCTDPRLMLYWLKACTCPQKLRFFACACCRRVWNLLDQTGHSLVGLAEQYGQNLGISKSKMRRARQQIRPYDWVFWKLNPNGSSSPHYSTGYYIARAVRAATWVRRDQRHGEYTWAKAAEASDSTALALVPDEHRIEDRAVFETMPEWKQEQTAQAALLRTLFDFHEVEKKCH